MAHNNRTEKQKALKSIKAFLKWTESEGFEPSSPFGLPDFESGSL